MESRLELFREPGERTLPNGLVEEVRRKAGRPKERVVFHVRSAKDVETLRRRKVPVSMLTPEKVSEAGYPMTFAPMVVVPEGLAKDVRSDLRVLRVRNPETLREESLEMLATLMLRFDKLAARALVERNRSKVRASELYRVVVNEGLERAASKVRFQDFAPDLPVVGTQLPKRDLEWVAQNNPPRSPL